MSIRLTNLGDDDVSGVELVDLLLVDSDGYERASFPVVQLLNSGASFDGDVEAGESVDLRIEFKGPYRLFELIEGASDQYDSKLRLILQAPGQDTSTLETPALDMLPSVAT